jgi:RNA polymerase sigma factor (sigma-70 family)
MLGEAFDSILTASQAGAEWAFERLYAEFNPRLHRYFAARAPGAQEDLSADTWMSAAQNLGRFSGHERQFRSWLFTIAYRRLADHWQQIASAPDLLDPAAMTAWVGSSDPEAAVLDSMSAAEAGRRIARSLPPDQADVILLRVLGGLDVDQVAEIMAKRAGAIRALQHRAIRKLKKEISLECVTE